MNATDILKSTDHDFDNVSRTNSILYLAYMLSIISSDRLPIPNYFYSYFGKVYYKGIQTRFDIVCNICCGSSITPSQNEYKHIEFFNTVVFKTLHMSDKELRGLIRNKKWSIWGDIKYSVIKQQSRCLDYDEIMGDTIGETV